MPEFVIRNKEAEDQRRVCSKREEGERRLAEDGRDGCYLVRNSDSVAGVYCLCVLCQGCVYTYRLYMNVGGSWTADTAPGVPKRYFRKVRNMIAAFKEPDQGIAMPLLFPVTAQSRAGCHADGKTKSGAATPNHRRRHVAFCSVDGEGNGGGGTR